MAGVYIHVPFCHSKCAYCDFYSLINNSSSRAFVDAIDREWMMRAPEIADQPVMTVYIGGGTPSSLQADDLEHLLDIVNRRLDISRVTEFTLEANPEDITPELVSMLVDKGVNRVSMGVQSLVDVQLEALGRRHTAARAIEAADTLRSGGIGNISLDLIYGLPDQSVESFDYSLNTLLDLRPEHFSAYILSYEPHTRMSALLKAGKIAPASDSVIADQYSLLIETADRRGYDHYEISNFALTGRKAVHNSNYWNGTPYLGLGPAAHSFDGILRRFNPSSISQYLTGINSGGSAAIIDPEDDNNRFNDRLITALRTSVGLNLADIDQSRRSQLLSDAAPYLQSGEMLLIDNRLSIAESSWLISDSIMSDLIQID